MDTASPFEESVFLNVPFDERYSPLVIALVAGLAALGRDPHCVLEVPSGGRNRLDRIYDLIAACGSSLHDLSWVALSSPLRVPRFNMPFELGVAYAIARQHPHSFFVLEARSHRLQVSLSDLNGHDPHSTGEPRRESCDVCSTASGLDRTNLPSRLTPPSGSLVRRV